MLNRFRNLVLALVALSPSLAQAQISNAELNSLGLEQAWQSLARVPASGRGIVSADIWIDETSVRKYAVVDIPGNPMIRVAADRLDAKNNPIGMEKAKAEAQARAAKLLGKNEGITVAEVNIPQTRLVITTLDGLVQNFDAESGKLLWATACGSSSISTIPAAYSTQGVLVVQGDVLYVLDWVTGKQLTTKKLTNSVACTVSVIDGLIEPPPGSNRETRQNSMAIVGDYSGTLTAFGLTEKINPWTGRINSRSEARPATSPDRKTLAVASNSGRVYVYSGSTQPSVQFRFETTSTISRSLAAGKDGFYIGTGEGVLAKIGFDGRQKWTFHLSHPIAQPAFYDTESGLVFLASESGEFTAIDDATGHEAWENSINSNILAPLGTSGSNVICRSSDDCIVSFDKKTGQLRGRTNSLRLLPTPIVNTMTDRVYLASNTGQIQCLRPIGKDLPKISKDIAAPVAKPKAEKANVEQEPMNAAPVGGDPFGGGGDMPAGGNPAGGADPFGADPFSGGGNP